MTSYFGIDLLLETQKGKINSENDVLMIVIHWILCKNNFRSVGVGDNVRQFVYFSISRNSSSYSFQKVFNEDDKPTELLPQGWNEDQSNYSLRYALEKNIFILYGIVSDDTLILNLLVIYEELLHGNKLTIDTIFVIGCKIIKNGFARSET
jgi:proteasome inhibitor subunit 1 (PI31)